MIVRIMSRWTGLRRRIAPRAALDAAVLCQLPIGLADDEQAIRRSEPLGQKGVRCGGASSNAVENAKAECPSLRLNPRRGRADPGHWVDGRPIATAARQIGCNTVGAVQHQ